jgi:uncharacterized protein YdiU (UPF0061 family)
MEELSDLEFWSKAGIFSANDRRRMMDTEYVSELAVAYLNGIQNKKTRLEDFYQLYEKEFDESERLKSVFFKVLGEIEQIIPDIRELRFRKKSDFYTLFVVLASYERNLPFSEDVRSKAAEELVKFSSDVDRYLTSAADAFSEQVKEYAKNVERAASDLASRRQRHLALAKVLANALASASMSTGNVMPAFAEPTE